MRGNEQENLGRNWAQSKSKDQQPAAVGFSAESTSSLYSKMRLAARKGQHRLVREVVEFLVKERRERPSLEHYNALILANISTDPGSAWRVTDLLEEMLQSGFKLDSATCHAVLKVLAVHPDHLLRTDLLEYMRSKWIAVSEDGEHDITAGLLREGLFEQALERLDGMGIRQMVTQSWLLDMFVYMLCEAGELGEAYSIMNARHVNGELNMSRSLWHYVLEKASAANHMDATSLAWKTQVNLGYINPSSGTCLSVLSTASRGGDTSLATAIFTQLSKRGEVFKPLHYQLLIDAYLNASPPDVIRALSILTLMPAEKLQPTVWQTRSLFLCIRNSPDLTHAAFAQLRALHEEGRGIPIAAFNALIESWIYQKNLVEALRVYKQIHTFAPQTSGEPKTLANVDTFNLLLKGCRTENPPDEAQASFLAGEMRALRVEPNSLTYDRLILVYSLASEHHARPAASAPDAGGETDGTARVKMLLDWATQHFMEMQPLGLMPRFGTVSKLATQLAKVQDSRCWDVLQLAEDAGEEKIEGWREKSKWTWANVEKAWSQAAGEGSVPEDEGDGWGQMGAALNG